jgi:glycogenin
MGQRDETRPMSSSKAPSAPKRCFMSLLATDAYLPGVLVLNASLKRAGTSIPFRLLITEQISQAAKSSLDRHEISYKAVTAIRPATAVSDAAIRWADTYSKLHIFNQTDWDKLVYLDADMLMYQPIDELFDAPHMAAVNAGGQLPGRSDWVQLNSGLMVVEPSSALFCDMMAKFDALYLPSGGDQDFLHAYYPEWPSRPALHLDHGFNLFHSDLDAYSQHFGYGLTGSTRPVKIVHYIGSPKPWADPERTGSPVSRARAMILGHARDTRQNARAMLAGLKQPTRLADTGPVTGRRLERRAIADWWRIHASLASM